MDVGWGYARLRKTKEGFLEQEASKLKPERQGELERSLPTGGRSLVMARKLIQYKEVLKSKDGAGKDMGHGNKRRS
jgi:hypothetical protein